ncbi:unnamed protein product [Phytophthora fragariaefolia]|uniref:Unnamed protein product n=1 Tax=Phytophthora fragariaefolia TaxID=1490495 RepID=A0A9W6U4T5_9STRA|nr:unnamed protein product [Phytophthora fragariaefolia]
MPIGRHWRRWSASWAKQLSHGFPNLSAEQQKARVGRSDKYEPSLIAHMSAAAQEAARAAMRAEAQSAAQASATNAASFAAHPTTTKPVKMSIPTFDGKDSDSLVFWVREIEIALSAGQIYDARAQVAFALSNLAHGPWPVKRQPRGKRSLQDYVMDLHNLEAAMAGAPLPEDVKVTVFMDGVRTGPVRSSPASQKEQIPGTTLLCLSVAAVRSNLVVVTASVKGYPEPMTVLIDSGASFNFATKASVARNNALYASALEASKSNTNVSVRLATGSIVSTRKVTIPLKVKFDDFDSVEPFIVLDMDARYDLIPGMPWLAKHEPWIDWPPPTQSVAARSAHVEEGAGVVTRANKSGRAGTPTTPGVVAGSARATEGAEACARATTGGRAGAPTSKAIRDDKVTSSPKAEASGRDADSAAEDSAPQVLEVFTGEPKVGEVLKPLPTVAELLELEELSYVEDSLFGLIPWSGRCPDPEKVCAIAQWPVPVSQNDLRKWLGLANYLQKYSAKYADMARPLTNLLKKDAVWSWTSKAQQAFETIKSSLQIAPILALPDEDRPFSVVCDASDFTIGSALLQVDAEGRERVVSFQSRQLKESPLYELIREAYAGDGDLACLVEAPSVPNKTVRLTARQRSRLHRYSVVEGLLYYQVDAGDEPRIVVTNDEDLCHRVLYEAHDTPLSGHLEREKTYTSVAHNFRWPHMYKWVRLDRDPRFVSHFWQHLFRLLGTRLDMSTADHPQPAGSTASPSADGRRPPSPERTFPRQPGQERESERQLEPLRGVRLASPSGPPGHTDSGSRRGASPSLGAPIRRSPRLANIGRLRHQDGISAQATPTRGLVDGLSPGGHPGAYPGGSPLLGRERAAPPSQSAGHPTVVDRTPNRPEGSPGQDGSQPVDAVRPGRTPLPSRAPPPLFGSEGALYYHVERLLKRRVRSGQYQYLVTWRGYPSSRNSWEPGARLEEGCANLVAAFESAHEPGRR